MKYIHSMNWHEYFTCDADAGILYFKERPREMFSTLRGWRVWNAQNANRAVGSPNAAGYLMVRLNKKRLYVVHRIIWEMVNGPIPDGMEVDHENTAKSDNKISNLRLATHSQNGFNKRKPRTNTSGYKGVTFHRATRKWASQIVANGKRIHIGLHESKDEAYAAYKVAAKNIHGEFARVA